MRDNVREALLFLGITSAVLLVSVLAPPVLAATPEEVLSPLRGYCARLSGVHFKAKTVTTVTVGGKVGRAQPGQFEYWADGDRCRIDSKFEGHTPQDVIDWSVAYDGSRFQSMDNRGSLLTFGSKRVDNHAALPMNPLYDPLLFLLSEDELARRKHLELADVKDDARWQKILGQARMVSDDGKEAVMEIPAASSDKQGTGQKAIRITFRNQEGFGYLPATIEFPADKDGVANRIAVDEYQAVATEGGTIPLPRVTRIVAGENGVTMVSMESTMETLELNAVLPPGIFTIDASKANTVWDEDAKVFVKTLGGFRRRDKSLDLSLSADVSSSASELASEAPTSEANREGAAAALQERQTVALPKRAGRGKVLPYCLAAIGLALGITGVYILTRKKGNSRGQ